MTDDADDIKTVTSAENFDNISRDVDSYAIVATSLKSFKLNTKMTIQTSKTALSHCTNKKMCEIIEKKYPGFCKKALKNCELRLGGADEQSIVVLFRAASIKYKNGKIVEELGKTFMRWVCKAFNRLPHSSWSVVHNKIVDEPNSSLPINFFQQDWIEFVGYLEDVIGREVGDNRLTFLYYICRHGLKSDMQAALDEVDRRIDRRHTDQIVIYQIHAALELTPPYNTAVFADLDKLTMLGEFPTKSSTYLYEHLYGHYGYFRHMTLVYNCPALTYLGVYNPLFHQRRFNDTCSCTATCLLGDTVAFGRLKQLKITLPDKNKQFETNLIGYIQNIQSFIPARAEVVVTRYKIDDMRYDVIDEELTKILHRFFARKTLVIVQGQLFQQYVSNIDNLYHRLNLLRTGMIKPATKQSISCLYQVENELIWAIERSYQWCNSSRRTPDGKVGEDTVYDLNILDLKSSTLTHPVIKEEILRIYVNLPRINWSEYPMALNKDGSLNKEYIVVMLYTAYAIETGGIRPFHRDITRRPRYCPLHYLNEKFVRAHKAGAFISMALPVNDAVNCIVFPHTVAGAIITSFVYTEEELTESTVRKLTKYFIRNKIDIFPQKLIEPLAMRPPTYAWTPLLFPADISSQRPARDASPSKIHKIHPKTRRQFNLPQYQPPRHNPFKKYNEERKKNQLEKNDISPVAKRCRNDNEVINLSSDDPNESGVMNEEKGATSRQDQHFNSNSSFDFALGMSLRNDKENINCHNDDPSESGDMNEDRGAASEQEEDLISNSSFDFALEMALDSLRGLDADTGEPLAVEQINEVEDMSEGGQEEDMNSSGSIDFCAEFYKQCLERGDL